MQLFEASFWKGGKGNIDKIYKFFVIFKPTSQESESALSVAGFLCEKSLPVNWRNSSFFSFSGGFWSK